jgi:hypothetical protein
MRYLAIAFFSLIPLVAIAAEPPLAPSPAPGAAACPVGMVCIPTQFVQQAVLQLGLRDPIGGPLAQYLQQSETQHK